MGFPRNRFAQQLPLWEKNPTNFWQLYKSDLKLMAYEWRKVMVVRASSCATERQNSLAGFILDHRRWNMSPAQTRAIVLQHNRHFFDGVTIQF